MSNIPEKLLYAKSHEWVRFESDGSAVVGVSDYAQSSLGDITFVQLPSVGAELKQGETFGVIESVKAASDLYSPVAGKVAAVNSKMNSAPETVNRDPYGEGWLIRLTMAGPAAGLLDAKAYGAQLG